MSTPETIIAKLREASSAFSGMFSQRMAGGLFADLFREVPTTAGQYAKISGLYPVGQMEDAVGTATVDGLDAAEYLIKTKGRRYTGGIEHEILMTGDSAFEGEVSRQIMLSSEIVACDIERRFTTLLEANGNDIFGSAFFADTKTIPGTAISFDNLRSGAWSDSAAEVRASVFEGILAFELMLNSMNCRVHGTSDEGGTRYVLMYHPNIKAFVMDALNPELSNDAARLDSMGVTARSNPYLTDADDLYLFAVDPVFTPFVLAKRGEVEFRNTLGLLNEYNVIMENQHLWQPYYAAEVGYGSAFSGVKLVDA